MASRRRRIDTRFVASDVDLERVEDVDDTATGGDLCGRCECPRDLHTDGDGECFGCGHCRKFKEAAL